MKYQKIIFATAILFLIGGISSFGWRNFSESVVSNSKSVTGNSVISLSDVDYRNDEALVGAFHNIFVGRVVGYIGTTDVGIGPESQYQVEVVYNIKGDLKNSITLDVTADEDGNKATLEMGSIYLFMTRYSSKYGWYTADLNASKLMSQDKNLTVAQVQALASSDKRVYELLIAYTHEILLAADVYHNNTKNSFSSLSPAEQQSTLAKIQAFVPSEPIQ